MRTSTGEEPPRPASPDRGFAGVDEPVTADVYARYHGELLGFAARALGDRGSAEDVVQETFVRAWRAGDRFDPSRASMRTWLFAIARNAVVDARRRRGVRPSLAPVDDDPVEPEDHFERLLTGMQLEEALRRLTPEHRQVVVEVHLRGRSCAELAAELNLPPSTVRSRLVYAVRGLRATLEEGGWLA